MKDKEILFIATGIPPNSIGISGGDKRWIEFLRFNILNKIKSSVVTSSGGIKVLQSQKIQPNNIINFYSKNFLGRLSFFILAFKSIFFKNKKYQKRKDLIIYSAHELLFDVLIALKLKLHNPDSKWVAIIHWLPPSPFWKRKNSNFINSLLFFINQRLSMYLISKFADCTTTYKTNFDKIYKTGIKFNNLNEVYCGLDFNKSSQIADYEEKIYDAAFVGRLQHIKGIFDLVNIWKLYVNDINPSGKLVIIGEGINKNELINKIKENNLENNIDIIGFLPNQHGPLEYVAKSKYFIFPSYEEAWAIVIGEAMACKTPVFCYSLEELKLVWENNLFYSNIGNYKNIFENIKKFNYETDKYKKIQSSAYDFVAKYDWNKIFNKDIKIIEKL